MIIVDEDEKVIGAGVFRLGDRCIFRGGAGIREVWGTITEFILVNANKDDSQNDDDEHIEKRAMAVLDWETVDVFQSYKLPFAVSLLNLSRI